MPGKLIVFSGLDGAGKSTQLELLRSRLDTAGIRHATYWSRGGYTAGMETAKALMRRLTGQRFIPAVGESATRTKQLGKSWKRRLWLRLAIVDLWALYAVCFRVQMLRGRYVLADRYWQDTLLDFRLNFPADNVEAWWLWKCFVSSIPTPQHAFLLTVPIEESARRGAEKNEPFPTPPAQLRSRARQYEAWASNGSPSRFAWHRLSGMRYPQALADEIWTCVTSGSPPTSGPSASIEPLRQPTSLTDSRS